VELLITRPRQTSRFVDFASLKRKSRACFLEENVVRARKNRSGNRAIGKEVGENRLLLWCRPKIEPSLVRKGQFCESIFRREVE
jgi:hypothetical protein